MGGCRCNSLGCAALVGVSAAAGRHPHVVVGAARRTPSGRVGVPPVGPKQCARGFAGGLACSARQVQATYCGCTALGGTVWCGSTSNNGFCCGPCTGPWLALRVVAIAGVGACRGLAPQRQLACLRRHPRLVQSVSGAFVTLGVTKLQAAPTPTGRLRSVTVRG